MADLRETLVNVFGLNEFRPAQREVIEDVLGGKDVLCVMPTGAGKSLCYQLPASELGGLTIVVSPLISLMADQVQQLRDEGLTAEMLNSALDGDEQRRVLRELEAGFNGLLYVAPERFFASSFQNVMGKLSGRGQVKLFAVDEAHCISQWGHDFRTEYSQLGQIRQRLGNPTTIALTATATEDVRTDIVQRLGLREPTIVVTGFDRPNLRYESRAVSGGKKKDEALVELLMRESWGAGGGIVYCATRKNVESVTVVLSNRLRGRKVFAYHAGMTHEERTASQEGWMEAASGIAVATNAFGMGINKPDTRWVVHYNMPGTLEAYYQEAGRAGRDGLPALCVMLFSYQDRYTQEFFIDKIGESQNGEPKGAADLAVIEKIKEHARAKLDLIVKYGSTRICRRQMILDYFGDESEVVDCHCDVCRREDDVTVISGPAPVLPDEVVMLVRQLLSGVARLHGKFGVGAVAEVLTGAENDRMLRWELHRLSVHGLLKAHSTKRVVAMLHRLLEAGLARQRDPEGKKFMPVIELTAAGVAVMKGEAMPPVSLADLMPRIGSRASGTNPRALGTNPRARAEAGIVEDETPEVRERFERLRSCRARLAKEKAVPPYCICHDSTLKLIASRAPGTMAALEQIKGMGPYKVKTYGRVLLNAIGPEGSRLESQVAPDPFDD
jgi:ATP-dependent DNA helicase RecQ